MPVPLASARSKLARAAEHLEALDVEIRTFAYSERDHFRAKRDPEISESFEPVWHGNELPTRFSVIVGDFLSNLRSALDHAVNGIAGDSAGDYTKFPIYIRRSQFKGSAKGDLEGVPRPCRAQIERMQPYHGHRRGKRLLKLAQLVNFDKHKVIHAIPALIYQGLILPEGFQSGSVFMVDGGFLGKAEVKITVSGPDTEPKVESGAPYQILFANTIDERTQSPVIVATRVDLGILLDEVRGIIAEIGDEPGAA